MGVCCAWLMPSCSGWGNAPKPCSAKCSRWTSGWRASTAKPTSCAFGAEHHRNELVEQLRFNRTRIGLIRDELLKDHDGTI